MPVIMDSKKIIPAPFVSIAPEIIRTEDGQLRSSVFVITLTGKIVAEKGSPNSVGTFWTLSGYPPDENISSDGRLASLRNKKAALTNVFQQNEGKLFEVQPYDGSAAIKGNVRLRNIQFSEGIWYEYVDYIITLEANSLVFGTTNVLALSLAESPAEESWSLEQSDDQGKTYRLTHTVTSQQKRTYNADGSVLAEGWENARTRVLLKLGIDTGLLSTPNPVDLSGWSAYNYVRGISVDEAVGRYSVNESWLIYDNSLTNGKAALEDYAVEYRKGEDGRVSVSINGSVNGLEIRDNTTHDLVSTRWTNAQLRYNELEGSLHTLAQSYSGATLNSTALDITVSRNPNTGVITFSRTYNDRPTVFTGAISANVEVVDTNPSNVIAEIIVLGRAAGPILQDIETVTSKKRDISISLVMPVSTLTFTASRPNTDSLANSYKPSVSAYQTLDRISWNDVLGRYNRSIQWTYE